MNTSTLTLNVDLDNAKQTQALANFFATLAQDRPTIHTIDYRKEPGPVETEVGPPVEALTPEAIPGAFTTKEPATEATTTEKPKRSRTRKVAEPEENTEKAEEVQTEEVTEPEENTEKAAKSEETQTETPTELSLEYVREKLAELIRGNVQNRITVKNELAERWGVENVTSLPKEKYGEFYEFLKTL